MNVAIIEFNSFHDECLYTQVKYLKASPGVNVHLICNHRLHSRINFWNLIDDKLLIHSNLWGLGYFKVLRFLNKMNIEVCVFNSTFYPSVKRLLVLDSSTRNYYGIVHNRKEFLDNKLSPYLKRRLKGFLVLNDYMLQNISKFKLAPSQVESFYAILYQECKILELPKPEDEIWVIIPGLLESFRRDYDRLLEDIQTNTLKKSVKLIFMGQSVFRKGGKKPVRVGLEKADKNNSFLFWDSFVDKDSFYTYMVKADYILPLIHSKHASSKNYEDKISGAFNLGIGFRKQFILESFFKEIDDLELNSIFYNPEDNLADVLNKLDKPNAKEFKLLDKWSFDHQSKKYLSFIGLSPGSSEATIKDGFQS